MDSNIVTLNSIELIKWCKARKKELEVSNAVIAEKTGIPVGTIDRILSGNYSEFKYSSIQPVIAFLIGFSNDTPKPQDADLDQAHYYYNTIEGYKLIVENKNYQISHLNNTVEAMTKAREYLKDEIAHKNQQIQQLQELISKMTDTIGQMAVER